MTEDTIDSSIDVKPIRNVFLTVGTTEFDELLSFLENSSRGFLDLLSSLTCTQLTIQIGRGSFDITNSELISYGKQIGIDVNIYRFKPTLAEDMEAADLILSHCGAGSILEALALKKLLIVIVNSTLQGNHQRELSDELAEGHHCLSTDVEGLLDLLESFRVKRAQGGLRLRPFTTANYNIFPAIVDSLFPR